MNEETILDEVYVVADPFVTRAYRGVLDTEADGFALTRGEELPERPLRVDHYQGDIVYDVIWTTLAAPIIISEGVVDLLNQAEASGWGRFEVDVRDRVGEPIPGYYGLSVTGRTGPIREELSPLVDTIYPGGRFKDRLGVRFDPDTWDGSDVFVPEGGTIVFVRDQIRRLFERQKIRNVKLRKATDIRQPT